MRKLATATNELANGERLVADLRGLRGDRAWSTHDHAAVVRDDDGDARVKGEIIADDRTRPFEASSAVFHLEGFKPTSAFTARQTTTSGMPASGDDPASGAPTCANLAMSPPKERTSEVKT